MSEWVHECVCVCVCACACACACACVCVRARGCVFIDIMRKSVRLFS